LTLSQPGKSLQHGISATTLYHRSRSSDRQMHGKTEIEKWLSIWTIQLLIERNWRNHVWRLFGSVKRTICHIHRIFQLQTFISVANWRGKWQEANSSLQRIFWRWSDGSQMRFRERNLNQFFKDGKEVWGNASGVAETTFSEKNLVNWS
jgi:hypothetical protein